MRRAKMSKNTLAKTRKNGSSDKEKQAKTRRKGGETKGIKFRERGEFRNRLGSRGLYIGNPSPPPPH
jgi:hypothetical protein